ncbi:hypothetical protein AcV5_009270 [Taiwanofungus camphoratus]|nr:hypothetical protein AcV5_009270 [Antrodia cinnamomea]
MEGILSCFCSSMSTVETLRLDSNWQSKKTCHDFPRLRSLSLSNTDLICPSVVFASLVRLDLRNIYFTGAPYMKDIMAMLRRCTRLEIFVACLKQNCTWSRTVLGRTFDPISLPRLHHFELHDIFHDISYYLEQLIVPPDATIRIVCPLESHIPLTVFFMYNGTLWSIFSRLREVDLTIS